MKKIILTIIIYLVVSAVVRHCQSPCTAILIAGEPYCLEELSIEGQDRVVSGYN